MELDASRAKDEPNAPVRSSVARTSPLAKNVLGEFRTRLYDAFGPRLLRVVLFGSQARGEATEHSDTDVFVLLDTATWNDRAEVHNIAGDLWRETDLLLSPLILDHETYQRWRRQERALVMDIERDGISV